MSAGPPEVRAGSAEATARSLFADGQVLHQQGRLADAAAVYREALQRDPNHAFALHYLGVIELQSGNAVAALRLISASLRLNDRIAAMHFNEATAWRALSRYQEALQSVERAVALDARNVDYWMLHGEVQLALERIEAALSSFDNAVASAPAAAAAHTQRGLTLARLRRFVPALEAFDRAASLAPKSAAAAVNRAGALAELGRSNAALDACDRALELTPNFAPALCYRAWALNDLQRPAEALQCADRAITLDPAFAAAYGNRGKSLQALDRPVEALAAYATVLELQPNNVQARMNAAHAHLSLGDFVQGFRLYESRKQLPVALGNRAFAQPLWRGQREIGGQRLLLHWEQGLGDTLQFCRYAVLALERGATVLLDVQPALRALLATLDARICVLSDEPSTAEFDWHCPLMSLPLAFGTRLASVPAGAPYLHAEPARTLRWQRHLGMHGFKVGIAWQGRREAAVDLGRSFPLRLFAPLAAVRGVRLISLQKGDGTAQLSGLPDGMAVETLGEFDEGSDAFLDTAAIMQCLDLVISSDTAVAHLAGALGRPAWIALQRAADWRWLRERDDSPWYPSLRLFRQTVPGDWATVFEKAARSARGCPDHICADVMRMQPWWTIVPVFIAG